MLTDYIGVCNRSDLATDQRLERTNWRSVVQKNASSSSAVNHCLLLLLLSCVNCHISRLVDASQVRVSSSRSVKPLSPFGGLCIVQSSMMCCTDWFGAPHSHSEVDFRPHLFMASPNLPTPVRIRLSTVCAAGPDLGRGRVC